MRSDTVDRLCLWANHRFAGISGWIRVRRPRKPCGRNGPQRQSVRTRVRARRRWARSGRPPKVDPADFQNFTPEGRNAHRWNRQVLVSRMCTTDSPTDALDESNPTLLLVRLAGSWGRTVPKSPTRRRNGLVSESGRREDAPLCAARRAGHDGEPICRPRRKAVDSDPPNGTDTAETTTMGGPSVRTVGLRQLVGGIV